jgi:ectoine hydroxylase-related dioxygenase (phytanoyl-CoA dioxygenase family)
MARTEALRAVEASVIPLTPIHLDLGDVLIRHPWVLHRGTPNRSAAPRPMVSIRYVRSWYADHSREVASIPREVWESLTPEQQKLMRFPQAVTQ